jgi:4-diphosphocytidyl-2-C-methyl-D-erythritol kinase
MGSLVLPAHAKLNLDLAVLGLRPDGFHEVRTRLQAISLHDLLAIAPAAETSLEGGTGADDLVLRAQRALEAAVCRPLPARFRLVKRIPVGAGLGGGSADAAAALRGLRRLHSLDCDLRPVAAGLGVDMPDPLAGGWFALAWPGIEVPTPAVYRAWDEVGGDGGNQLTRAAFAVRPDLAEFAGMLGEGWRMTGSGSAFFRHCSTRAEAERCAGGLACWTAVVRPVPAWGDGR